MRKTVKCPQCETRFWPYTRGRKKRYCSNACRQAAYRDRKRARAWEAWWKEYETRSTKQDKSTAVQT
jgi:hypothetical protein